MAITDDKQAAQVLVQALAKAQSRGVYEIHESALVHEALNLLGPKLGLVPEQAPVVQPVGEP
jgi:tellurite resistance protein